MEMIKLTGLWKHEGKEGTFYTGKLGQGGQILIFRNKFKTEDKHPDFNLFLAASQKKSEESKGEGDGL